MKIAFFWTWDFSANILKTLVENFEKQISIKLVVSQADKPVWRKKLLEKTPVKKLAQEKQLEILQPEKIKNNWEFFEKLKNLNLDFIVVVAYWKIIPCEILKIPKSWCINIHGSILPKYRWASPIQQSIKTWDKQTWITIMYMSKWMDEWDILKIKKIEIWEKEKTRDIFKKFEKIWPKLLVETLNWVIKWELKWIKQDETKASYCSKISKKDWEIFFSKQTWKEIYDKFRAYYDWPGIYSFFNWKKINFEKIEKTNKKAIWFKQWEVIKDEKQIWVVCFDKQIIIIKKVKLEWKKSMDILCFINWNKEFLNYKF